MSLFFFFNDTATTEIYTLSLHDALPISVRRFPWVPLRLVLLDEQRLLYSHPVALRSRHFSLSWRGTRSEEHTSELQSLAYLVCRLLLEKKNTFSRVDSTIVDRTCTSAIT